MYRCVISDFAFGVNMCSKSRFSIFFIYIVRTKYFVDIIYLYANINLLVETNENF